MKNESNVYLLGAGASKEAGLPLTAELVNLIIDDKRKLPLKHFMEPADVSTIQNFLTGLIKNEALIERSGLNPLNVEEILNLTATAEHLDMPLPYPGGRLIEGRIVREYVTWLILLVLESFTKDNLPSIYAQFAKLINLTDTVVTLNYDLVLEQLLQNKFGSFNYCLGLQTEQLESPNWKSDEGIHLLKLHGSMNWRECSHKSKDVDTSCGKFFVYTPNSLPAYGFGVTRVCKCGTGSLKSKIIPPLFLKLSTDKVLRNIWRISVEDIRKASRLIIIGYSLPAYDVAIKEMLRLARMANPKLQIMICNPDSNVFDNYKFLGSNGITFHDVTFSGVVDLLKYSA